MGILDKLFGCQEDYAEALEECDLEKYQKALEDLDEIERDIEKV
jgi:hypothetical protein